MFHKENTYREDDYHSTILKPISNSKGQTKDYAMDAKCKFPKYISGYTGKNVKTNKLQNYLFF